MAAPPSSTCHPTEGEPENSAESLRKFNMLDIGRANALTTQIPLNSSTQNDESPEIAAANSSMASLSAPMSANHSPPFNDIEQIESPTGPKARWRRVREDGQDLYVNEATDEKWIPATDSLGQTYYYEARSRVSVWTLDDFEDELVSPVCSIESGSQLNNGSIPDTPLSTNISSSDHTDQTQDPTALPCPNKEKRASTHKFQNTVLRLSPRRSMLKMLWDNPLLEPQQPIPDDVTRKVPPEGDRSARNQIVAEHISGPLENKLSHFERRGFVNRTKYIENNVRVHKRWGECVLILSGPWLSFRKKAGIQQGKLEFKLHVQKIEFSEPTEEETSRKHALKLEEKDDQGIINAYLIQTPDDKLINCWKAAIAYAKQLLDNEDRLTASLAKSTLKNLAVTPSKLDSRLTSRLRDFFRSRPSAEALRSRGILKNEPVFASTLVQICENENSEVPRFIVCAIRAIEARGLHHLGIYRVSANAADVQKLRCCVNQYNYSLNSERWTLEVLTSSLKLFFRELREPLFTFDTFHKIEQLFVSNISDSEMVSCLNDIIRSMPTPHIVTARVLFHHLYRVTQHCDSNQMHPHKLALIFGPGLLRPEDGSVHMGTVTTLQAPFVYFSIQHVTELFGPVIPPPVVV